MSLDGQQFSLLLAEKICTGEAICSEFEMHGMEPLFIKRRMRC